jgi:hypothetical protein
MEKKHAMIAGDSQRDEQASAKNAAVKNMVWPGQDLTANSVAKPCSDVAHVDVSTAYAAKNIVRIPAGSTEEFIYVPAAPIKGPLSRHLGRVLDCCRTFKTLDQHLADASAQLRVGPEHLESLERCIAQLVEEGLLISLPEVRAGLPVSGSASPTITSVGLITRDRPELIGRAVHSYLQNMAEHGRHSEIVVMDDSVGIAKQTEYGLRALARETGGDLQYAGREEKEGYAHLLSAYSQLRPELIRFALFDEEGGECAMGANRNALLLDTLGRLIFCADDDTVCRIVPHPNRRSGIRFSSGPSPLDLWFYPDRQSAVREANFVAEDVLSVHERLLGHSVADLMGGGEVEYCGEGIAAELLRVGQSGSGQVMVTIGGVLGDSATHSTWPLLKCRGDAYLRLTVSEQQYRSVLASREVLRVTDCATLEKTRFCMTAACGLDNRNWLPPFMPVQRNEDGVFGATLAACRDDNFCGHVPYAIIHDPRESRSSACDPLLPLGYIRFADILLACIGSHADPPWLTPEKKLQSLGGFLVELGSLPGPEFENHLRFWLFQEVGARIQSFENRLQDERDAPDYWRSDVNRAVDLLRASALNEDYTVPADLLCHRTAQDARSLARALVHRYGELLCAWPTIISAAKDLSQRGCRISRPVTKAS